jgi:carboxypeptidase Taq
MINNKEQSYEFISKQQKELSVLGGIGALLGWDQMTYMPPQGAAERSEQTALLSTLSHKRVVSETFWNHINNLTNHASLERLSPQQQIIVNRLHKDVERARKIPEDYVVRMAKTTTMAYPAWQKARNNNDFTIFKPHLETIIELEKEYCAYIDPEKPRYDILLDDYEEGMTATTLKQEFSVLKQQLQTLLKKIIASDTYQTQKDLSITVPKTIQQELSHDIIQKMTLSSETSRIDESTHPFTTSLGTNDVRITTSYERENPLFSFFSTIHEAGHALYELGMPQDEYKDTVISDSPSLGLHESQSRFWENMIARSKPFWEHYYTIMKQKAPQSFEKITEDGWYKHVNKVTPSFIRVEADELTYCLHVILRFEIETGLMNDSINVSELPQIWNEKMETFLSITPPTDREGVLQDMHWSGGSIGYFPTYAIGTIYSAQLYDTLLKQHPETITSIQHGEFNNILTWLRSNIHQHGRSMTADEIIRNTCGEGLNAETFITYLKQKYSEIYL